MKTNMLRNMAMMALVVISGSCLDYTVTTVVNRDGSVFRQYEVVGDSSGVFNGSLKVPSGSDWKVTHGLTYKDKGDTNSEKSQYMYTASRTFKNSSALNGWMADDTMRGRVKPSVNVVRHFRWFFTYYHYSESYPMSFPFQSLPVDSFLTELEQSVAIDDGRTVYSPEAKTMVWKEGREFALTPSDSAAMKDFSDACDMKMQRWMVTSMARSFIHLVDSAFGSEPAVKQLMGKSEDFINVIMQKYEPILDDSLSAYCLVVVADSLNGSQGMQDLYRSRPEAFKSFDKRLEEVGGIMNGDSYTHQLTLPGKVYTTNAKETTAKGLVWEVDPDYFVMKPYILTASSRIANPWIIVLTGLLALGLVFILVRRRH